MWMQTSCWTQGEHISFTYITIDSIEAPMLGAISQDTQGRMWIGSWGGGQYIYDGYHIRHLSAYPTDSLSIPSNYIVSFYHTPDGNTYECGKKTGLIKLDLKHKKVVHLPLFDEYKTSIDPIYSEAMLNIDGDLWLGTFNGLVELNSRMEVANIYKNPYIIAPNDIDDNRIMRIIRSDKDNILWIATPYGLKKFDLRSRQFINFKNPSKWHHKNPEWQNYNYWDLQQDKNGVLWMAAYSSGGVLSYDPSNNSWRQFLYNNNPDDPYAGNSIYSVLPINDTTVYFAGKLGFGQVDFKNKKLKILHNYDSKRGGKIRELFLDDNGILWLTGRKALIRSKQPIISSQRKRYLPGLIAATINEKKYDSFSSLKNLKIKNKPKNLSFELGIINPPPGDIQYKWRLQPETKWSAASTLRLIELNHLHFGHYQLEYASKINHQKWEYGTPLSFTITKPYYLQTSFLIRLFLGFMLIIGSWLWYRSAQKKKKLNSERAHQSQLAEMEMRSLRSQMNPHFIFNSMNSISNFIYNNKNEEATVYLAKFAQLMREVLYNSEEKLIPLKEEINIVQHYLELEKLRFNQKFDFVINTPQDMNLSAIYIPPLLLQPFLENALWHGIMHKEGFGFIQINLKNINNIIQIEITDNGVGRTASQQIKTKKSKSKKSYGLNITQNRLRLLNLIYKIQASADLIDLHDKGGNSLGTKVIIKISLLNKDTYESDYH